MSIPAVPTRPRITGRVGLAFALAGWLGLIVGCSGSSGQKGTTPASKPTEQAKNKAADKARGEDSPVPTRCRLRRLSPPNCRTT